MAVRTLAPAPAAPLRLAGLALLLLAGAAIHLPALGAWFLNDDFGWIWLAGRLDGEPLLEVFRTAFATDTAHPIWGGNFSRYMGLSVFSWILDYRLWGASPLAFHITNLTLHLLTALLLYRLARGFASPASAAPLFALTFFLLSPFGSEPVAWVSARGHAFASLLVLSAVLAFGRFRASGRRRWYLACLAATALAMLAFEPGLTTPALLLARDALDRPWRTRGIAGWLRPHVLIWALLVAYFALRLAIFGELTPPWSKPLIASTPEGVVGQVGRLADEAGRVAAAVAAAAVGRSVSLEEFHAPRLIRVGMVLGIALVALALARRLLAPARAIAGASLGLAFGLSWLAIGAMPLLQPLNYSPRHWYFPSVGAALALGFAVPMLARRGRWPRRLVSVGVATLVLLETALLAAWVGDYAQAGARLRQFHDQVGIAAAAARADPDSLLVLLPEVPHPTVPFVDDVMPAAVSHPFLSGVPLERLVTTYVSYCCDDWPEVVRPHFERLARDQVSRVHLVEWDPGRGAYVARSLDGAAFRRAGYPARLKDWWSPEPGQAPLPG